MRCSLTDFVLLQSETTTIATLDMPRTFQQLPCLLSFIFITYLQSPGHHASTSCSITQMRQQVMRRHCQTALTAQYCLPRNRPWKVILGLYQAHTRFVRYEFAVRHTRSPSPPQLVQLTIHCSCAVQWYRCATLLSASSYTTRLR